MNFTRPSLSQILALPVFLWVTTGFSQTGDAPADVPPSLVPAELVPDTRALSAEEELKTFQVAPGYRVELAASEPLVGDPIFAQFGPDGRLWVVEMRGYMPDIHGNHEDEPVGRIVILSDTDGDGRFDESKVFLDQLIMPRTVLPVGDGALVGAPPMLWYCPDKNGDGKADEKILVAQDAGAQTIPGRPELANPEHGANSPLWALDNWIYFAEYAARFRWRGAGTFERSVSSMRGQYGLSQDDFGRLFYNYNSGHLLGDMWPSHYRLRNPHYERAGGRIAPPVNQAVWPIRVTPGTNRAYIPENMDGHKLKNFTAACSPWIYRGDLFPEDALGNAFACEPALHLVKRDIVTMEEGKLVAREAYHQREFLASTDERFRPVSMTTGPDGALYVIDFYRGIIQHRISLSPYLEKYALERDLVEPRGLGRIWRIVPEKAQRRPVVNLTELDSAGLIPLLAHANSWHRETAQRLLVERADATTVPAIEALTRGEAALGRMHALWTLDGMEKMTWPVVESALDDADARVRNSAVRITEGFFAGKDRDAAMAKLIARATTEPDPQVQIQLVLTLGDVNDAKADQALAALATRVPDHPYLTEAILSGVKGRELELLEHCLATGSGKTLIPGLAGCVAAERNPTRVLRLFALAEKAGATPRKNLLNGFASNAADFTRRTVKLDAKPALLDMPGTEKVAGMLTWPGKPAPAGFKPPRPLSAEEQSRFEMGRALYSGICAGCHQPNGAGLDGIAPPLVDSEWVTGSPDRLSRIVLHGVRGYITVKKKRYQLDMPPLGALGDEPLAAILTYIRREWEHGAEPITPEFLKEVREKESRRTDSWTEKELLQFP
jgi:mono/diheme cytochrome c family protein/glucose/arabinose dehydrogenase